MGGSALVWGARGSKRNNDGSNPSSELKSETSSYVLFTESSSEMMFITFGCSISSVGSITPCVVGTVLSWTGVDVRSGVMGTSVGSGVEPTEVVAGIVASKENGSGVSGRGDGEVSTSIGVGEAGSNGGIMSLSGATSTEAAGEVSITEVGVLASGGSGSGTCRMSGMTSYDTSVGGVS